MTNELKAKIVAMVRELSSLGYSEYDAACNELLALLPEADRKALVREIAGEPMTKAEAIDMISSLKVGQQIKIGKCYVQRIVGGRYDVSTNPIHGASIHRSPRSTYREVAFRNNR